MKKGADKRKAKLLQFVLIQFGNAIQSGASGYDIFSTIACPKPEQETRVAPVIWRSRS